MMQQFKLLRTDLDRLKRSITGQQSQDFAVDCRQEAKGRELSLMSRDPNLVTRWGGTESGLFFGPEPLFIIPASDVPSLSLSELL